MPKIKTNKALTAKQFVKHFYPDLYDDIFGGDVVLCPYMVGLDDDGLCKNGGCIACWNRYASICGWQVYDHTQLHITKNEAALIKSYVKTEKENRPLGNTITSRRELGKFFSNHDIIIPDMFYAGKKHKIVCAGDCYHARNIKFKNRLFYFSLEDAIQDGCRPCKHCLGKTKEGTKK